MLAKILTLLSVFQQPYFGGCPKDLKFQPDIHYKQLEDKWYEHSKYPNFIQDPNRCTSVNFVAHSDTEMFLYITNLDAFGIKDVVKNIYSDMIDDAFDFLQVDPLKNIWKAIMEILRFHEFKVLSTDYTNYAIVYNCYELNELPLHFRLVWIMTRERVPSNETLQVVHNILTENKLSLDPLIKTDQDNCDEGVDD